MIKPHMREKFAGSSDPVFILFIRLDSLVAIVVKPLSKKSA